MRITATEFDRARAGYHRFIAVTSAGEADFRLTPRAEPTPYARCFAVFGLHLLGQSQALEGHAVQLATAIRVDLDLIRQHRLASGVDLAYDKTYLQLLTFSLSALAILGQLSADPLAHHVLPLLPRDIETYLARTGALAGVARSGNMAMFAAILLLHARDRLNQPVDASLAIWRDAHLASMNRFGFWGEARSMSHLQFQNGYHQYEILEYLGIEVPLWETAANHVASLADDRGHFAPYPGGGGCFDYDAVFLITGAGPATVDRYRDLLKRTATSILAGQNEDGGFAESQLVRPRGWGQLSRFARHVLNAKGLARRERLRQAFTLQRPRHDRIHTHWSQYSRGWNESDLWDSWFRMLTIARIDVALHGTSSGAWGFVPFPGIGYHPLLRGGHG